MGIFASRAPPVSTAAPRAWASATCSSILAATGSLLSGPIVVVGRERVAEDDPLADRPAEQLDELVVDRAVHEDPLAGRAALPGAQEAGGQRRLHRRLEVGVVEHDDRAVAAHLEHRGLAGRGLRRRGARWQSSR